MYPYTENDPVNWLDPWGLFGDGLNAGGDHYGHSDFYGHDQFDFTKEDHGWLAPFWPWATKRHFRDLQDVENDLAADVLGCVVGSLERHMHQGQDYFVHYGKDFRWYKFGHIPDDLNFPSQGFQIPTDQRYNEWRGANKWTKRWVEKWRIMCDCD